MKDMASFDEIDKARRLLRIGEAATLEEVRRAYRVLAHQHHPDKRDSANEEDNELMKKLNRSYKLLLEYCADYKYSFKEEAVAETYPYEQNMGKWRENWFNSI